MGFCLFISEGGLQRGDVELLTALASVAMTLKQSLLPFSPRLSELSDQFCSSAGGKQFSVIQVNRCIIPTLPQQQQSEYF